MANIEENIKNFANSARGKLTSLPKSSRTPAPSSESSGILWAIATAGFLYSFYPEIVSTIGLKEIAVDRTSSQDELISVYGGIASYFLSKIKPLSLCSSKDEQRKKSFQNYGIFLAAFIPGGLTASQMLGLALLDIKTLGFISVTTISSLGFAKLWNKYSKKKTCSTCHKVDSCDHVVCRHCLFLHEDEKSLPNCEYKRQLGWEDVALYLKSEGLNYPESVALLETNFKFWDHLPDGNGEETKITCNSFHAWLKKTENLNLYSKKIDKLTPSMERHIRELEGTYPQIN